MYDIFLNSDVWKKAQITVDGDIPGLVVLGSLKKAGCVSYNEQASKEHPSMVSASAPASKFLPCLSSCPDFLQRKQDVEVEDKQTPSSQTAFDWTV